MMEQSTTTQQVRIPNPTGKGGFGDHPENRSPGGWDKNNSFSYWMNFFKAMSVEDFKNYEKIKPEKERTMAEMLAYARVFKARNELREFEVVANRTEGMPTQPLEHSGSIEQELKVGEETQGIISEFIKWRIGKK